MFTYVFKDVLGCNYVKAAFSVRMLKMVFLSSNTSLYFPCPPPCGLFLSRFLRQENFPITQKSAVLLRRFCLAQKMEQGNAIQLSVVLFLSADNRCTDDCTATDEQQGDPQSKVACIAGLRRLRILRCRRSHRLLGAIAVSESYFLD